MPPYNDSCKVCFQHCPICGRENPDVVGGLVVSDASAVDVGWARKAAQRISRRIALPESDLEIGPSEDRMTEIILSEFSKRHRGVYRKPEDVH